MDLPLLEAFELKGMSSSTSLAIWVMVIFLLVLIIGIALVLKKQYDQRNKIEQPLSTNQSRGKGF